jgi:hypothetical protein
MGIDSDMARFLSYCKENGVNFESTLQIGRQNCYFSSEVLGIKSGDFAEPYFTFLGAKKVDSLDYSDYQQASIIHDMNLPINNDLKEKYSIVIDGGTLEHVFNYPVAVKSCMEMVRIGGHLILATPANNFPGHGFYQFSPELFFSLLGECNGFSETRLFMQDDRYRWFEVRNPQNIKCRVDICIAKNNPSLLYVVSKKIGSTPEKLNVLQSDYVDVWENKPSSGLGKRKMDEMLVSFARRFIPSDLRKFIKKFRYSRKTKMKMFYKRADLGSVIFKQMKLF